MRKLFGFFIFIFILMFSCDQSVNMLLGVGQALDSQSPEISVTSPENGIYVNKSAITIEGKCSDNVGVTRINAQAEIAGVTSTVTKNVNLRSVREGSWSVTFEADELERGLNLWRSGLKVTFTLTCCDAAGNSMVEHIFLYIDTDLPEVTINTPETRFSDNEKIDYEKNPSLFAQDYDMNKFERVNSFVNGEFIIKGYVDDNYSVKSTYINIFDATKKNVVAVTPTIYRDGTPEEKHENAFGTVRGNSQSWEFVLDSMAICQTEGWYAIEVVTEDEAGNEKKQFVDKSWIYINQAADVPKNNFISFEGRKLNAGNEIAGNCFDDDGMREVWIKIVPESQNDSVTPYTEWKECEESSYIIKKNVDFENGVRLVNWSLKIPSKAGNYKIYAVPVDIHGVAVSAPYDDIYASYFSVASEEDPVIVLDSKFRGSTIVEKAKITGYFYDNVEVSKINVAMMFDEQEMRNITLYDISKSSNDIEITNVDSRFELSTGQIVTKYSFGWDFIPSDYTAYKTLSLTFTAEDKDKNYGEDAITIYGDSERPAFVGEISPANNSNIEKENVFTGMVSDNVDVVSVTIKAVESSSWKEDVICSLGDAKKVNGKMVRVFESREILPTEFGGWSDREFTITAKDAVGNEASQIITLKGDKNKPEIAFVDDAGEVEKSGNYVTKSKILNVRITPKSFDDGTQREIIGATYLTGTQKSESLSIKKEGNNYTAQIEVSKLGNISGDVTLQVTATDDAGNEGQGTIYFIVDNEAPSNLAITSPLLENKAEITNLADNVDDINENDISYYQNGVIQLKGTVSDNYKIGRTELNICDESGKEVLQIVLTTNENGELSLKSDSEVVMNASGIPGNFTIELDTAKLSDGDYILKTTSYDAAGNSSSWGDEENAENKEYYFKVLQDADKPRITFNIESDTTIYPGTMLKGLLIDDDAIDRVRFILGKEVFDDPLKKFNAPNDAHVQLLKDVKQHNRQDWILDDEISGVGMYHLYMLAEDIYGTESKLYTMKFTVSSPDSAFIKSVSSEKGTGGSSGNEYYSGNVKIIVGAAAGGENMLEYIYYKITSSDIETTDNEIDHTAELSENFVLTSSENLGGWHKYKFLKSEPSRDDIELEFDSRLFVKDKTETITIEVRCQDTETISATIKDKISIDNEGVSLKVTSPLSSVSVNKTFEILGSCNDRGAGVGDIYIGYMKDSSAQNVTLEDINNNLCDEPTLNRWIKVENDGISWRHEYVSTLINDSASLKDYKVQIAATDILGNIEVITHDIKIDQDEDRPIIRCQNLPLQLNGESWCKVSSIYGTVSDDDGGISEFYISEDGGKSWSNNCYDEGSWMHSFATDGEKELYFKVVDGKNTEFISKVTNILESPKIVDSTGAKFGYENINETGFTIKVDTNNPSLTSIYYNKNGKSDFDGNINETDWDSAFVDKVFGGDEKMIYILFGATDANGIDIEKTKLECSTVNLSDKISLVSHKSVNDYEYFVYKVDISSVNNSYLTFKANVTDNSGLPTATTFQINIDNEAPSIVITNYSDNAEIYGSNENLIKGSTGDAHKTKSVEYAFSIENKIPTSGWKQLEDTEGNNFAAWEAEFEKEVLNDEVKRLYAINDFTEENYYLYFWVKATDIFGNVSEAVSVYLNVLPNGDKPTVYFSYPTGGEILGGVIRITGTAQVLTGEVTDVSIQMDLDYNGKTFDVDSENPIDSVSKTNWSLTINKDRKLMGNVAVRAKATSSAEKSTLSEIVAFQIDSLVPLFGQSEELTLVQYDSNGNELKRKLYEANTWVSGEGWNLEGSVEDDSGISEINKIVTSGKIGEIEKTEKGFASGNSGYSLKIPLDTENFGFIDFILKAIDKSGDNPASNTASIAINYDNTAPTFETEKLSTSDMTRTKIENTNGIYTINGTFEEISSGRDNQSGFERIAMYFTRKVGDTATYIIDPMLQKGDDGDSNRYDVNSLVADDTGMYWREGTAQSTADNEIKIDSIPKNVRPGGLCKINETIYRITSVDNNTISVSDTLPTLTNTPVYFAIAQVIDNQTIESGKTTVYDDGNAITYDDGDKMVEGVYRSGSSYEWTVSINSENIFDGDVDVHFVAFDKAGNYTKQTYYASVANNTPRIAGVILAMDNNVNGSIDGNEIQTGFANIYNATVSPSDGRLEDVSVNGKLPNGNKVTELNLPLEGNETLMTIKGDTKVTAKIVGGNAGLQWRWKVGNYTSGLKTLSSSHSDGDGLREDLSMTISMADFLNAEIGNKTKTKLQIEIWDNTEGKTAGTDTKCAVININVNTQIIDTTEPQIEITPFYWESESNNSLYQNSRANGHIELEADLTSAIINELGNEPKVSGKITIEGTASDNVRVDKLKAKIDGFNGETEFTVATRSDDGKNWTSTGNMANDGWACEISDDTFTKDGNTLKWKLHWDTSKIKDVTATDVNVQVKAVDRGMASANGNTVTYSDGKESTDVYQMDVVPYITNVKRNSGYTSKRAGSGAYPLLRTETGNTVEGFNLAGETLALKITSDKAGTSAVVSMESVVKSGANITFTVPDTAKDGYLHLTVNDIPALNNVNKRKAPYNLDSKTLSDDCFARIWQDKDRFGNEDAGDTGVELAKNPAYPAMSMDESGKLYASFTNYSMHNVYYTTIGGKAIPVFNGYDSPEETTIFVTGSGSSTQVNVAYMANYQSGGSYEKWTHHIDDAGGLHLYDPHLQTMNSTESNTESTYDFNVAGFRNHCMSRFELLYHDKQFQQFKNFRLVRANANIGKYIHTAYYDIDTMSIHYSNVSIKKSNNYSTHVGRQQFEASWVNIDGGYDDHDTQQMEGKLFKRADGTSLAIYSDGDYNIILNEDQFSDGLTRSSATGEYVGIDVTPGKHYPVLAYFDSVNKVVKLARANAENPKRNMDYKDKGGSSCENGANNWTVQRVITKSSDPNYIATNGSYVDMKIDTAGYVHVVFVNGRGELIYVKSTNNPNDGKTAYTFGDSVVIAENSPMNLDITVRGTTPYIGYLTSLGSCDGLNTAFWDNTLDLDNDGTPEGGWETMSAPLQNSISNTRASVEVYPKPTDASAWGESAHAYFSAGYYRVAYYIGSGTGH